jgi:hypothetical protein
VYRAAAVPDEWLLAVDGADITTGTVTAAALAADFVLATLFRTAGSGNRVELQGAGHAFPFWIGSGTKGTASGSPGSGAKVYYDSVADKFVITGELVASRLRASAGAVLDVVTSSGYQAPIGGQVGLVGSGTAPQGGAYTTCATAQLLHPSNNHANSWRRLQSAVQSFNIQGIIKSVIVGGSGAGYVYGRWKLQYSYDGGAWQDSYELDLSSVYDLSTTAENADAIDYIFNSYAAKSTGWSSTLDLRVQAKEVSNLRDLSVQPTLHIEILNLGSGGTNPVVLT